VGVEGWLFQSAPLNCLRGDRTSEALEDRQVWFQSAPLNCLRGDPVAGIRWSIAGGVSIRAPQLLEGRLRVVRRQKTPMTFQSAPLNCLRGDHAPTRGSGETVCFNPRPSIA